MQHLKLKSKSQNRKQIKGMNLQNVYILYSGGTMSVLTLTVLFWR